MASNLRKFFEEDPTMQKFNKGEMRWGDYVLAHPEEDEARHVVPDAAPVARPAAYVPPHRINRPAAPLYSRRRSPNRRGRSPNRRAVHHSPNRRAVHHSPNRRAVHHSASPSPSPRARRPSPPRARAASPRRGRSPNRRAVHRSPSRRRSPNRRPRSPSVNEFGRNINYRPRRSPTRRGTRYFNNTTRRYTRVPRVFNEATRRYVTPPN